MVDVCICSYNPDPNKMRLVLNAIATQSARQAINTVIIVDNGSSPKLDNNLLSCFKQTDIAARIVFESTQGIINARIRAINESTSDWLLFVDDDNELALDYVEQGIAFFKSNPDVGCFGGKLLLPEHLKPPRWAAPFLPFLGLRDEGEKVISNFSNEYGPWEPPTAGAWLHRSVANEFLRRVDLQPELLLLGRKGTTGLASCEDSLIMRGASVVDLKNAYVPQLVLWHHLDQRKFKMLFLLKLLFAFGSSHMLLESSLAGKVKNNRCYSSLFRTLLLMKFSFLKNTTKSFVFAVGTALYHYGAYKQYSRLINIKNGD